MSNPAAGVADGSAESQNGGGGGGGGDMQAAMRPEQALCCMLLPAVNLGSLPALGPTNTTAGPGS